MRKILAAVSVVVLGACQAAPGGQAVRTAGAAGQDLMAGTSWSFTVPNAGEVIATFGTDGRYYDLNRGKIIESGTFVTTGGQVCEDVDATPTKDNLCWTVPATLPPVGGTITTTSNKGLTLRATRLAFRGNRTGS